MIIKPGRWAILLLITACFLHRALSQETSDILLNERLIDRPLTMHRNQLQFNAGYGLKYATGLFSDTGESINMEEEGKSVLTHNYGLDLRYGIFGFVEIYAGTNIISRNERIRQVVKLGYDNIASYGGNIDTKGFEDLDLRLSLSVPFLPDFADISLMAGAVLPFRGSGPEEPRHEVTNPYQIPGAYDISYSYFNKPGNDIIFSVYGAAIKLAIQNMALVSRAGYAFPLEEGTGITWHSRLSGNTVEYEEESYEYLPPAFLHYSNMFYYQAFPWFAVELEVSGIKSYGGWRESYGQRYSLPELNYLSAGGGFEIMVTPALRLYQSFSFPVSGKNTNAGISIRTGISLNHFPF